MSYDATNTSTETLNGPAPKTGRAALNGHLQDSTTGAGVREPAVSEEGFVFDVGSLCAHFARLQDGRKRRGKRYTLVVILVVMVLAKLSGQDTPAGIAEWARLRAEGLAELLKLKRKRMPHAVTYERVLGKAIQAEQFEQEIKAFFSSLSKVQQENHWAMDGKQIRGTTSDSDESNEYLLGLYVPGVDVMLMQVAMACKEGELTAAPQILKTVNLRGKVLTGDAL